MRVVLQVVKKAQLSINNQLYSSINEGFLLLVGYTFDDNEEIVRKMIDKIISLRLFKDENGKTNLGFLDLNKELMCVSQFTLYASIKKGRRPSFTSALGGEQAKKLYDYTVEYLKTYVPNIQQGVFGEDMQINLINDGPFTLMIDDKEL
jgi:D-tyrosyl-tRNA(Tyr) deacylase